MAGLPGTAFHQVYGMTELSPLATHADAGDQHTSEDATTRTGSAPAGRAAIGCEVRIVDADGSRCRAAWSAKSWCAARS